MVTHRESLIIDISRSLKELSTLMHQTQATNISSGCIEKKMAFLECFFDQNQGVKSGKTGGFFTMFDDGVEKP